MNFINLTPHEINAHKTDGTTVSIPPDGTVARVEMKTVQMVEQDGFSFVHSVKQKTIGLPEPVVGVLFIVSAMVREANPFRMDVVSPGPLIRNDKGQPIGCQGFEMN